MIQRIQSLLLLLAAIAAVVVNFIPIGDIVNAAKEPLFQYDSFSLKIYQDGNVENGIISTVYVALLWIVSAILSVVTIFLYKKRQIQILLNNINMVTMLLALVVMLYVYPNIVFVTNQFITETAVLEFNHWILISLIPAISLFFANTAIKKDEKKVRAADRLR